MIKPEIRYLSEMKRVLYDKKWLKTAFNFPVYYMYRGVKKNQKSKIKNQKLETPSLRYDITIIPPKMLGEEFVKTKGHYHLGDYGELYKVISGEGIFLLQKDENGEIKDVYYVKAKKGDFVLSPPGYGHTIINPGKGVLKISNWISKKCRAEYKSIEKKRGFCYYYTDLGWTKNNLYRNIPKIRPKKPFKKFPKNLNLLK